MREVASAMKSVDCMVVGGRLLVNGQSTDGDTNGNDQQTAWLTGSAMKSVCDVALQSRIFVPA